jgi:hypothetical protein
VALVSALGAMKGAVLLPHSCRSIPAHWLITGRAGTALVVDKLQQESTTSVPSVARLPIDGLKRSRPADPH